MLLNMEINKNFHQKYLKFLGMENLVISNIINIMKNNKLYTKLIL